MGERPHKKSTDVILPERAPALSLPMRFFVLGLLFLATLLGVAIRKAPMLAADYLHNPVTLAVTHLFTLGLGGSVVTGAVYQMAPVLMHSRLGSERMAHVHLYLHGLGVIGMVIGFLGFEPLWVISGGTLVLTGGVLFVVNMALTFRQAENWSPHGLYMAGAILFYLSTLTWGIIMALNQQYGFLGEVEGAPLAGHISIGFLGWFGLMLIGVGLKLIPMFAPAKPLPTQLLFLVGSGYTLGVLILLTGLYTQPLLLWTGLLLAGGALVAYAGAVLYTLLHRRSGALDFSVRFGVTAALLMLVPVVAFVPAGRHLRAGLLFLFALGWVGSTILGMMLRIVPFMVWLHRFRNRLQKLEKIPFLHEMFEPRWGWLAYLTWFPGILLMAIGLAWQNAPTIQAGALLGIVALLALSRALGQVLFHVPPGTPALFPGKKPGG